MRIVRRAFWIMAFLGSAPAVAVDPTPSSSIVWLPPVVSPGDVVRFPLLQRVPPGGVWRVAGEAAAPAKDGAALTVKLPSTLLPGEPFEVTYILPSGQEVVRASTGDAVRVLPLAQSSKPGFGLCGPQMTQHPVSCLCGSFPDEATRNGLLVDGQPAGLPFASSGRSVCLRLSQGSHRISGAGAEAEVSFIHIVQEPPKPVPLNNAFPVTFTVLGTSSPVRLRVRNVTPDIGELKGGDTQILVTSGGDKNTAVGQAIKRREDRFRLEALLLEPASPFRSKTYLNMLEEVFQQQLSQISDRFSGARRALRNKALRNRWYRSYDVQELLLTTQKEIQNALPYPELSAFRDYVNSLFDEALQQLGPGVLGIRPVAFQSGTPAGLAEKDAVDIWLQRISEFLDYIRGQKLTRNLHIRSSPVKEAPFEMYPRSYPSDKWPTSTDDSLCNIPLGRYVYKVHKNGFQEVTSTIDLLREEQQILDCSLQKNSAAIPCKLQQGKAEGCQ